MREHTDDRHNSKQRNGFRLSINGLIVLVVLYIGYLVVSSFQV